MLELLVEAVVAFLLSFVIIYVSSFLIDVILSGKNEGDFHFENIIKKGKDKL